MQCFITGKQYDQIMMKLRKANSQIVQSNENTLLRQGVPNQKQASGTNPSRLQTAKTQTISITFVHCCSSTLCHWTEAWPIRRPNRRKAQIKSIIFAQYCSSILDHWSDIILHCLLISLSPCLPVGKWTWTRLASCR